MQNHATKVPYHTIEAPLLSTQGLDMQRLSTRRRDLVRLPAVAAPLVELGEGLLRQTHPRPQGQAAKALIRANRLCFQG